MVTDFKILIKIIEDFYKKHTINSEIFLNAYYCVYKHYETEHEIYFRRCKGTCNCIAKELKIFNTSKFEYDFSEFMKEDTNQVLDILLSRNNKEKIEKELNVSFSVVSFDQRNTLVLEGIKRIIIKVSQEALNFLILYLIGKILKRYEMLFLNFCSFLDDGLTSFYEKRHDKIINRKFIKKLQEAMINNIYLNTFYTQFSCEIDLMSNLWQKILKLVKEQGQRIYIKDVFSLCASRTSEIVDFLDISTFKLIVLLKKYNEFNSKFFNNFDVLILHDLLIQKLQNQLAKFIDYAHILLKRNQDISYIYSIFLLLGKTNELIGLLRDLLNEKFPVNFMDQNLMPKLLFTIIQKIIFLKKILPMNSIENSEYRNLFLIAYENIDKNVFSTLFAKELHLAQIKTFKGKIKFEPVKSIILTCEYNEFLKKKLLENLKIRILSTDINIKLESVIANLFEKSGFLDYKNKLGLFYADIKKHLLIYTKIPQSHIRSLNTIECHKNEIDNIYIEEICKNDAFGENFNEIVTEKKILDYKMFDKKICSDFFTNTDSSKKQVISLRENSDGGVFITDTIFYAPEIYIKLEGFLVVHKVIVDCYVLSQNNWKLSGEKIILPSELQEMETILMKNIVYSGKDISIKFDYKNSFVSFMFNNVSIGLNTKMFCVIKTLENNQYLECNSISELVGFDAANELDTLLNCGLISKLNEKYILNDNFNEPNLNLFEYNLTDSGFKGNNERNIAFSLQYLLESKIMIYLKKQKKVDKQILLENFKNYDYVEYTLKILAEKGFINVCNDYICFIP
ncbi:hypothetical protein EDEG_01755 [Edhazardia aedis USNM 41457]|uniref:Uncharacterized protein n=1 Tax=Edhazardia aedis (strain USNM 41457) TaxID=1003232 RepID=J9D832_EDHAE|nr:hypothetical protein EDEG_01755 [Edhazardia aedis USNM 41457]|eukprot:EJW03946.1 hypothetical protein EDEG_01755 [Edhazardia aedis USNM 41457]